jgi:6-phosphogluconate dehydrogenase
MQIGILGLGKMGSKVMDKLLQGGHEVVAWNRTKNVIEQLNFTHSDYLLNHALKLSNHIEAMREILMKPRVFWLMLPQGEATTEIISQIEDIAEPGDIIIDGGDANYKDTQKRYDELTPKGIKFLGIGIAGGTLGLESGFCLMAGGNKDGYEYVRPALDSMVIPEGGHNYFGQGGAGHFIKMVHTGIEYGVMQSLGEGFGVLQKSRYDINLLDAGSIWQRGSILRSFLLDMAVKSFVSDPDFIKNDGIIETSEETKWMVEAASLERVPVEVITKSLEFRQRSQYDKATQNSLAAKLVAAIRKQFSGHEDNKAIGE